MTVGLVGAVVNPGRIHALVEEIALQISANSLQNQTMDEARSLPDEQKRELARALFRYNFRVALLYNSNANLSLGPESEKPYRV